MPPADAKINMGDPLRKTGIIAISRTGTYTLKEWDSFDKRGGTLRELVDEYLENQPEPIASLDKICEYISLFRSNVKQDSIKHNLILEATGKYCLYHKDGEIYVGFASHNFGNLYEPVEKNYECRSFSESIDLLRKFIQTNARFPRASSTDKEESRLYRFYQITISKLRKGTLQDNERTLLNEFEKFYSNFKQGGQLSLF